jgi:hypothetical protein
MQMVVLLFRKNQLYDNPLDPAAFARYAAWMAIALKDQPVAAYQIWNEPSNFDFRAQYGGSWNGRGYAPWVENYSELTRQAAAAIRAADPHAVIIANLEGPALAYALKQYPQDFRNLDGIALHPYTFRGPAESVPWGGAIVDVRDGVASADSDHSLASYLRIAAVDHPEAYLGRPFAPWVTEYGFPTCDSAQAKSMYACVTPEVQAAYHVRGLILGLTQSVKLWTVYEFADEGDNSAADGDNFGLVASAKQNFAPKPAFFALQRVATILGPDWRAIPQPPARLEIATNDAGRTIFTALHRSPASTTEGPQAFWFATPSSYVAFLWRAGSYDTDTVDSRVELRSSLALHSSNSIRVIDLVSGAMLKPQVTIEQGAVRVDHLPLGSRPLVLEFPINRRPSAPASAN